MEAERRGGGGLAARRGTGGGAAWGWRRSAVEGRDGGARGRWRSGGAGAADGGAEALRPTRETYASSLPAHEIACICLVTPRSCPHLARHHLVAASSPSPPRAVAGLLRANVPPHLTNRGPLAALCWIRRRQLQLRSFCRQQPRWCGRRARLVRAALVVASEARAMLVVQSVGIDGMPRPVCWWCERHIQQDRPVGPWSSGAATISDDEVKRALAGGSHRHLCHA
ncbi:hypothetical protein SETIT_3G145300v2 [Setaria italica]|uniref:Uncharacterized protein n=1 Tax=Setaria italica TaxID=4555 RepID=A0A368QF68_SETIT|nr:hypothetical protein SETIT_3G145300v2 [Setaria italica]RCV16523.1 hypothetical protein SETIT_3G145300v2 [Setaria italica]RCV16524.1 hypothetical protein SETIT_3G145300v2 [Setaria italica]RCV16525.1 hypothetical protein SETIT_3G145300v2 [Setaria italica]RCV16526.1 hypothetical protein SETIT_3G145300v2 [Setaria italica]